MENNELLYWLSITFSENLSLRRVKPVVMEWCIEQGEPLATLFELSPDELTAQFDLTATEAAQLLEVGKTAPDYASLVAKLTEREIKVLTRPEARYPRQWIDSLPPLHQPLVIFYRGDFFILDEPSAALVGSREPNDMMQTYVRDLAAGLAIEGVTIASGYAPGVDRLAFDSALEVADGCTIAVLPQGFFTVQQTLQKWTPLLDGGRVLVFSPFHPETQPTEILAEARNQLVTALANMIFLCEVTGAQIDEEMNQRINAWVGAGKKVFVRDGDTTVEETLEQMRGVLANERRIEEQDAVYEEDADFNEEDLPDVPPIDGETALDILEKGGKVPQALRARLKKRGSE